jgi:hypothetical protein
VSWQGRGLFRRGCCETPVACVDGVPCLLRRLGSSHSRPAAVGRRRPP